MSEYYIDYDFLMKTIIDDIINKFDYPLDYDEISQYILSLSYGEKRVIDVVENDNKCYIDSNSYEIINTIIEKCNVLLECSREDYEVLMQEIVDEDEKEFFYNEILKWEQLINLLTVMKSSEFALPKSGKYTFVALPVGKGCSLDNSIYDDHSDIQATLSNLDYMEKTISSSMDNKGTIITRQRGNGLHKAGKHCMYKDVGSNQRILFKQCRDNPNVFFVLTVSCNVHGSGAEDKAREKQYDGLTEDLDQYLDSISTDGKVVIKDDTLIKLSNLYDGYKVSLANRIRSSKKSKKIDKLKELALRISKKIKENEMKVGESYD